MNRNPPANNSPVDNGGSAGNQFIEMRDRRLETSGVSEIVEGVHSACPEQITSGTQWGEAASSGLISGALSQLPLHDREQALNEMHGVDEPREESNEFVESKIMELKEQLSRCTKQPYDPRAEAIMLATVQNPEFAVHRVCCERFLKCSGYDVPKAAAAMFRYYSLKRELWGEKKLSKEIELDDLNEDDIDVLKKGLFQVLPERDRAGRQINAAVLNNQKFPSVKCLGRVLWYTFQLRLDQRSESMAVWITFYITNPSTIMMNPLLLRIYQEVISVFPIKNAAFHHCVGDANTVEFQTFMTKTLSALDSENKAKTKVHSGLFSYWMDSLRTYGIPPHIAPVNEDGRIRVKNHLEALQGRKAGEHLLKNSGEQVVFLPLNSDILFGRGKPIQQTAGNLRLTAIVDSYVLEYHDLKLKQEKTALAAKIVQMVKSASGRFLSRHTGIWTVVDDDVAREKVSGLFRTLYRKRGGGQDTGDSEMKDSPHNQHADDVSMES